MAIMSYCDLSLSAGLDEFIAKNLGEIKKQAETGAALTRQLLAFSRKQVLVPKVIDLNRVLRDMEPMIRRLLREDIAIVLNLDASLGKIQADPYQIEQVVMNLVVNAKDAMPNGGWLTIQTSVQEFHSGSQLEDVPIEKGRYIKLAVTDTGLGMDDLTRLKIFEPFFTTKEVGKGSGLGLSSVYGIIKQSGGYIFVSSRPNSGSTFSIYLPELSVHLKPESVQEQPVATLQNAPAGSHTILLVDDNAPVRSALGALLNLQGYNVFEASNGSEAMELCSDHGMKVDLLITDMVMPLIGGHELSEKLGARYPHLKTLYMSGYAEDTVLREALSDHSSAFLQKPVSMKMFLEKIQSLLA
jgi:CheY-like chemotaxis protein